MTRTGFLVLCTAVLVGCGASPTSTPAPDPKTEDEKAIYALGYGLSRQIDPLHLTEAEVEIFKAGLADGVLHHPPKVEPEKYRDRIAQLADGRSQAAAAKEREAGAKFVEKAAQEEGAKKLETGLVLKTIVEGSGQTPTLSDTVRVRYTGTLIDGTVFDGNASESEPAALPMGQVIPCWAQALQLMKEGGKAKLYCPADLAYGDRGFPPTIAPGATLVFDVELVGVGG